MGWFEFPHTRTYDSDLGWIIANMKTNIDAIKWLQRYAETHQPEYEALKEKVDALVNGLVDVIEPWDSSIEYPIYSIVSYQGQNYIAIRPVPVGAMITNEYYWQEANTVVEQINAIGTVVSEMEKTAVNYYVTPQMFGAVGDGVTDDTAAFQAAAAAIREHIYKKDYTDGGPAEYVGGYEFYIPGGTYILTESVEIPSNGVTHGAGKNATILRFTGSDYGLSFKGDPYNGLRYWRGAVRDLTVVMDGAGVGVSNIEYCDSTAAGQNAVVSSVIENVQVMHADVGIGIIGSWNSQILSCNVQHCLIGILQDRLDDVNGNNSNSIINTAATSCVMAGFWLSMAGGYLEGINAESVGDTFLQSYTGQTLTYCGKTYSVDYPAGVYCNGVCSIEVHGLWFERITTLASDSSPMYGLLINTSSDRNNYPLGVISVYDMRANTDVYAPVYALSECMFTLDGVIWSPTSADYKLAKIQSSTYGAYRFRNMLEYLADKVEVTNKTAYNAVTFENIRSLGALGNSRLYCKSDVQTYNILDAQKFVYTPNTNYNLSYRTRVTTADLRLVHDVNGAAVLSMGYGTGKQAVYFPANVALVSLAAGATTATVAFKDPYHNDVAPAGVVLSARTAAGANVLKGGYYWSASDISGGTITITFLQAPTAACTFDALVYKK